MRNITPSTATTIANTDGADPVRDADQEPRHEAVQQAEREGRHQRQHEQRHQPLVLEKALVRQHQARRERGFRVIVSPSADLRRCRVEAAPQGQVGDRAERRRQEQS